MWMAHDCLFYLVMEDPHQAAQAIRIRKNPMKLTLGRDAGHNFASFIYQAADSFEGAQGDISRMQADLKSIRKFWNGQEKRMGPLHTVVQQRVCLEKHEHVLELGKALITANEASTG